MFSGRRRRPGWDCCRCHGFLPIPDPFRGRPGRPAKIYDTEPLRVKGEPVTAETPRLALRNGRVARKALAKRNGAANHQTKRQQSEKQKDQAGHGVPGERQFAVAAATATCGTDASRRTFVIIRVRSRIVIGWLRQGLAFGEVRILVADRRQPTLR